MSEGGWAEQMHDVERHVAACLTRRGRARRSPASACRCSVTACRVLDPRGFAEARRYLDRIATQWEDALLRLKAFVED